MKWTNCGHELDDYAEILRKLHITSIYIFGCGEYGIPLADLLLQKNLFAGFIDNNQEKQGRFERGRQILSLENYVKSEAYRNSHIVVAASAYNQEIIKEQLNQSGLIEGRDFFLYNDFLYKIYPIIMTYEYDTSFVALAQISLTERCTLKCKKCAHACYAVSKETEDLLLDEVYRSADEFFAKVDMIQEFVLIGGEPLLYQQLGDAITYIGEKYREQINLFCITTNGTIVPSEQILKLCKKYNVLFRISNYTVALPRLERNIRLLVEALEKYEITYILNNPDLAWMDYGFESFERVEDETEWIKAFSECGTPCREVRNSHYYYCVMARSVSENLNFGVGEDDYLDLRELDGAGYKKRLLEYNLGYSNKGYLDMCRYCRGKDANNYPIPAAEQVKL